VAKKVRSACVLPLRPSSIPFRRASTKAGSRHKEFINALTVYINHLSCVSYFKSQHIYFYEHRKIKLAMKYIFSVLWILCALLQAQAQHEHDSESKPVVNNAFDSIKSLVGNWKGTYKWTGIRTGEGEANFAYSLTGGGSAVIEHFMHKGQPFMTTVYHVDNTDIRATHYCATNTQPRFKADTYNEKENSINFQFVDVTNYLKPELGHISGIELKFERADRLLILWHYTSSKGDSLERIELTRTN